MLVLFFLLLSACGRIDYEPIVVSESPDDIVELGAGSSHGCVLRRRGTVECFGNDDAGQLGDGDGPAGAGPRPVVGIDDATQLTVGYAHTCVLRRTGRVWCWGLNSSGQLGDGTTTDRDEPVEALRIEDIVRVRAALGFGTCAIDDEGALFCFGSNGLGQLGVQSFEANLVLPVRVPFPDDVTDVGLGVLHGCALRGDGSVVCAGMNAQGQRGDGTLRTTGDATETLGLSAVRELRSGSDHACAIDDVAGFRCWGHNHAKQLGQPDAVNRRAPVPVMGLGEVRSFGLGHGHSCAITTGDVAYCWGQNWAGQLGDGTTVSHSQPMPVLVDGPVAAIAAGTDHTCLLADGHVYCFGTNGGGRLGLEGGDRSTPTLVDGL